MKLFLTALVSATAFASPSFECKDGSGATYSIFLTPKEKRLEIQKNKSAQTFLLTEPNLGKASKPSEPAHYYISKKSGRTVYSQFDFSTEVRVHFYRENESSFVSVGIVMDHKEVEPLQCKTSKYQVKVVEPSIKADLSIRLAEPILENAYDLDASGRISEIAILALEASLLRVEHMKVEGKADVFSAYVNRVSPILKKLPSQTYTILSNRLSAEEQKLVDSILEKIGYKYYASAKRFVDWVQDGVQQNNPKLVQAGMGGFVRSPFFAQEDLKGFFTEESRRIMDQVQPYLMAEAAVGLNETQAAFLMELWPDKQKRADFKFIRDAFPQFQGMIHCLTRDLKPDEKGVRTHFAEFADNYTRLIRSRVFVEAPILRAMFLEHVVPAIEKLSGAELSHLRRLIPSKDAATFDTVASRMLASPEKAPPSPKKGGTPYDP